jgi:hypothetical protein
VDPKTFFESWLPDSFARVAPANDTSVIADVSCVAQVEAETWHLSVTDGKLSVVAVGEECPATFRLVTDRKSFDRVIGEVAATQPRVPTLRAPRLDAETCRLVANVPGLLQLVVKEGTERYRVVFGPGSRDPQEVACTVSCDMQDVQAVREGRANPMELFMNGRLTLEGNIEVAMALGGLFL